MSITLAVDIVSSRDNPIILSESPGSTVFQIDDELFGVIGALPPSMMTVPGDGSAGAGRLVTIPNVAITVERGFAGSVPAAHTAGATVTPLWPAYAATPGAVVTVP